MLLRKEYILRTYMLIAIKWKCLWNKVDSQVYWEVLTSKETWRWKTMTWEEKLCQCFAFLRKCFAFPEKLCIRSQKNWVLKGDLKVSWRNTKTLQAKTRDFGISAEVFRILFVQWIWVYYSLQAYTTLYRNCEQYSVGHVTSKWLPSWGD